MMGTSKITPSKWMEVNGTKAGANVVQTARGWEQVYPDGHKELLHALNGPGGEEINPPTISRCTNPKGEFSVTDSDVVTFKISFIEEVIVTGTPQIAFQANSVGVTADYDATVSTKNTKHFKWTATGSPGDIDNVTTSVQLNGGTILDKDGIAAILAFKPTYTQPVAEVIL